MTEKTEIKLIGIDCEADGLLGPIWSIGAVALDTRGNVGDQFKLRTSYEPRDEWARENIWPVCEEIPISSRSEMLEYFWCWWRRLTDRGWITVADFGVLVEARLFRDMIIDEHPRWFEGPYPLHELGTLLLATGRDPDMPREELAREAGMIEFIQHNPVHDAEMTARAAYMLLKQLRDGRD